MKKNLWLSSPAATFIILMSVQIAQAQSWVISGNNNTTALSKLGTTNFIPLGLYTNNTERLHIDEIGRVGIGINAPVNVLTVKSTAGNNPSGSWLTGLTSPVFVGFANNASSEFVLATASNTSVRRSVIQGRKSRGTLDAPTAVANDDYLTSFLASGYDGTAFQNPATIDFFVDGVPSAGNVPARISFVTGSNQATRVERLKVGSTGNFTFNINQLFLQQSSGNIGMGTTTPAKHLHIYGPGDQEIAIQSTAVNGHQWTLQSNGGSVATTFQIVDRTAAASRFGITNLGNVGIGTTAPQAKLHIVHNSIDTDPQLLLHENEADYARLNFSNAASSNFFTLAGFPADAGENARFNLYYNGLGNILSATGNGEVGIGTSVPNAKLHVENPSDFTGINSFNSFTGLEDRVGIRSSSVNAPGWGYGVRSTGGFFGVSALGDGGDYQFGVFGIYGRAIGTAGNRYGVYGTAFGGTFNAAGYFEGDVWANTYNIISDRKFKTEIAPIKNPLQKIMKLKPSTYVFKKENIEKMGMPAGNQLGLIADEVKQVFPELVKDAVQPATYGKDKSDLLEPEVKYESVNYIGLIPVLIASAQEQQKQIEMQNTRLEEQQTEINNLKEMIKQLSAGKTIKTEINSVSLEQNNPNPLNNFTNITYTLPGSSRNAQLIVADLNGKTIKKVQLGSAATGNVSFDATNLASGTYTYSIFVNEKLMISKKMIVAKSPAH